MKLFYLSLLEDERETLADDWLLSRCASLRSLKYSSPDVKGNGVTLSGLVQGAVVVVCVLSSTHDSEKLDVQNLII